MSTGLKRISFPIKLFFPLIAGVLVVALLYVSFFRSTNQVKANIALFHPSTCLGGWKNVDKISGKPNVEADNGISYSDENSASLFNSNAQVFCGGFSGEIPAAVKHQKVALHFSWYIEDSSKRHEQKDSDLLQEEVESEDNDVSNQEAQQGEGVAPDESQTEPEPTEKETVPEESPVESVPAEEKDEVESAPEESAEPTAFHFFRNFISVAFAQEPEPEPTQESEPEPEAPTVEPAPIPVPEEPIETSEPPAPIETSPEVAEDIVASTTDEELATSSTKTSKRSVVVESVDAADAYFEVKYTLDGQVWNSLGFVSRIANDIEIEMPIDIFSTVADLERVQIALHTVDRFDSVSKIYLDALWLEVTYDDAGESDLVPPGQRPGDVIFSETTYEDTKAVVVLRNVALETLSNALTVASSTELIESVDVSTSSQAIDSTVTATSSTTSVQQSPALTDFVGTSTLASVISMTGVQVELWLYASSTQSWSRIADDSIISRNPQVKFESGSVFWVDKNNRSVWRYNPKSGGYDALSLSTGQVSTLRFRDEANEMKELEFSFGTSTVLLDDISVSDPESL